MTSYFTPTASTGPVKSFTIHHLDAAGNSMTADYPSWLRLYKGHLTRKEKAAYELLLPSMLTAFDQFKEDANSNSQPPLAKFVDKKGKQISFSKQWDMVVAEHVRFIIAPPGQCDRYSGDSDSDEDASFSSDVRALPPCLDSSSSDFSYSSEEDEDAGRSCQVPPLTAIPRLMFHDMSLKSTYTPSPAAPHTATANPHIVTSRSTPETPMGSRRNKTSGISSIVDDYLAHASNGLQTPSDLLIRELALQWNLGGNESGMLSQPLDQPVYYSPSDMDAPHRNNAYSGTTDLTNNNNSPYFVGPHAAFLNDMFSNLTRDHLVDFCIVYTLPTRPKIKHLVHLVQNEDAFSNRTTDRFRLVNYLTQLGGVEPTASRVDGIPSGDSADSGLQSSGETASGAAGVDVGAPASGATATSDHLRSLSGKTSMQNLHALIRKTTIARAIKLARQMSKHDMVVKLEETLSIELAKKFLKTPDAVFVIHKLYKGPGETVGVRAVPRHRVQAVSRISDSFMLIENREAGILAGPMDSSWVQSWSEAQKKTETHVQSHIKALELLLNSYRHDSRHLEQLRHHINCLKHCGPMFNVERERHKNRMDELSHLMTPKHSQIGNMLLRTLEMFTDPTIVKIRVAEEHLYALVAAQRRYPQESASDPTDSDSSDGDIRDFII